MSTLVLLVPRLQSQSCSKTWKSKSPGTSLITESEMWPKPPEFGHFLSELKKLQTFNTLGYI